MRGLKLLFLIFIFYILLLLYFVQEENGFSEPKHEFFGVLKYNGRFYKFDKNGEIYATASLNDALKYGFVSCVTLDDLQISKEEFEGIEKISSVIRSQYTSEVCLNKRVVIMLKGIMLYFHEWGSLSEYFDDIESVFPYLIPRTRVELSDNGKLVILRGGWKWQSTIYSQQ